MSDQITPTENPNADNLQLAAEDRVLGWCCICGRELTRTESAERMMGPECSSQGYRFDEVTVAPDPAAFAAALERAGLTISLEQGLNIASNKILRALTAYPGLPAERATAACDALRALGFYHSAALVGHALKVPGHDEANTDTKGRRVGAIKLDDGILKIKITRKQAAIDAVKEADGRRWHPQAKFWSAPATPANARCWLDVMATYYPRVDVADEIKALAQQPDPAPAAKPEPKPEPSRGLVATVKLDGQRVAINCPHPSATFVGMIKAINYKLRSYDPPTTTWHVALSCVEQAIVAVAEAATTAKHPWTVEVDPQLQAAIEAKAKRDAEAAELATATGSDETITLPGGTLYPFQVAGVHWLELQGSGIIGDDMGLGKTMQALAYIARSADRRPAIVVCPASVKANWCRKYREWCDPSGETRVELVKGNKLYPVDVTGRKLKPNGKVADMTADSRPDLLVVNYDLLRRHQAALTTAGFRTIILDEAHYIKESRSGRSKAAAAICAEIEHKVLLTGTPMLNRPRELWHLLHVVDPQTWSSFMNYAMDFCDPQRKHVGRGRYAWDFSGNSNLDELHRQIIGHYMVRRRKIDVLKDLPAKRRWVTELDVEDKARAEYDAAARSFKDWAQSKGSDVLAKHLRAEAITRLTGLRQLALHAKLAMAVEHVTSWLESTGEQCIVWAHHQAALDGLQGAIEEAGYPTVRIDGGTPAQSRQDAVDSMRSGEARVLVASILAAGAGIDGLQERCSHAVYVERTWRPADHSQSEDRLHRIGQERPVSVEYLDMARSIDTYLADMVDAKLRVIDAAIDGLGVEASNETVERGVLEALLDDQ